MTKSFYLALVLRVWEAISPDAPKTHDAPVIADAIATVSVEEERRGYIDAPLIAAVMAGYSWAESRNSIHPEPVSWDARAGQSCSVWQEPCLFTRYASVLEQARYWVSVMHQAGLAGLDSSPSRSAKRLAKAARLLDYAAAWMPR